MTTLQIERMQTGVRIEQRLLAALNSIAKKNKATLGDLMEEMILHAFEGSGACAFMHPEQLQPLLVSHGIDYDVHDNYGFTGDQDGALNRNEKAKPLQIKRAQAGFKIEKRLLKVLKGIAEYSDSTLGQAIEEIALHQFAGADAFAPSFIARVIEPLKTIYSLNYLTHDNHRFEEKKE